jgi:hypothetical protein
MQHKGTSANLRRTFDVGQTNIALTQEPWVYKYQVSRLGSNQGTIFTGTCRENPRTWIFVSKDIAACSLPQYSDRNIVSMLIRYRQGGEERKLIVCLVYHLSSI